MSDQWLVLCLSPQNMNESSIKKIIDQSLFAAEADGYAGYDPYDALNTSFDFLRRGKWPPVLLIQSLKRLPVNFRPMLGIHKGHNPKGIGLMLESYAALERVHPQEYSAAIEHLLELLEQLRTPEYSGTCWGYNFDWASPVKVLPKGSPTVVVTGFISKALFSVLENGPNEKAENMFRDIEGFVNNDLPSFSDETGLCISYSTVQKDCCFNASALAAGFYARLFQLTKNPIHRQNAIDIVNFVVYRQKENGSWAYSINLKTGAERIQTDFHQGFILDSILETMHCLNERPEKWMEAVKIGAAFYFQNQFAANGRSYFRLPRKYPIDVHHQAQGIITAVKVSAHFPQYLEDGERMVNWAVENMHDGDGRFFYRVFPAFKDKTRYFRWGQAWMTLALSQWYSLKMSGEKA